MSAALAALSADEARKLALWSQGFLGPRDRRGGPGAMLRRLGAVQLDTISVLARSHELVAYARLGPDPAGLVWRRPTGRRPRRSSTGRTPPASCRSGTGRCTRCAVPGTGRAGRAGGAPQGHPDALRDGGPQTARELGGARQGGDWWDWSPLKRAAEQLLAAGEVVCVTRRSWQRVYDLAERAIPEALRAQQPVRSTTARSRSSGARRRRWASARSTDLADYHRQRPSRLRTVIDDAGLVPVTVEGWDAPAWADPEALRALDARAAPHAPHDTCSRRLTR